VRKVDHTTATKTATKTATMIELRIDVSDTFPIPSVYTTGSMEEIEEALLIGAYVQAHVHQQRATQDLKALAANKEAEIAALRDQHDRALRVLSETLETQRRDLTALQQEMRLHQTAAAKALQDATAAARAQERERTMLEAEEKVAAAQRRLEAAEERKALLEASRAADIREAEARTRALLGEALQLREAQVLAGQQAFAALDATYKSQAEELRALNDFLRRRVTNVKTKGMEYEATFRDLLLRAFGILERFALVDTAKQGVGHAGDFLMTVAHKGVAQRVLWEVKNYDKPVPKSEVDKFQRDVLENADVRVGVMVSRSTDITGRASKGDREIEMLEGKLLIYLNRFEQMGEDLPVVLQSLLPLFQVWWFARGEEDVGDDEDGAAVKKVREGIQELNTLLGDLVRRRQEWRVHRSRMEETLQWVANQVEDAEVRVEAVLRHLQGGGVGGAGDLDIPTGVFRPIHMDERLRETIGILLEVYVGSTESEVRLSDLSDLVAAKKHIGKETAKKWVLAALADGAVVSAPGKPTRVRGLAPK
jgi:hypothetical protein